VSGRANEGEGGSAWILALVAAMAILPGLGVPQLSLDESTTIDIVHKARELKSLGAAVAMHLDGFLFAAIHSFAEKILGDGYFALRLPEAFAAILSAPLLFFLMRIFVRKSRAFWYALIFSVSPISLYYAKEARPYAWIVFFFFCFLFCYFTPAIRKQWLRTALVALCSFALVMTHSTGVFYLAAFFLSVGAYRLSAGKYGKFRTDFITGLACCIVTLPVILNRFSQLRDLPQGYLGWTDISIFRVLAEEIVFINPHGFSGNDYTEAAILALIFVPVVVALAFKKEKPRKMLFLALWLSPPLLALILELLLKKKILYYPRAYFATLPFAIIFVVENSRLVIPGSFRLIFFISLCAALAYSSVKILFHTHGEYRSRHRLSDVVNWVEKNSGDRKIFVHLYALAPYFQAHSRTGRVYALGRSNRSEPFDLNLNVAMREMRDISLGEPFVLVTNKLAESFNDPDHRIEKLALMSRMPIADLSCGAGHGKIFCDRVLVFDAKNKPGINLLVSGHFVHVKSTTLLSDRVSGRECRLTHEDLTACGPFDAGRAYDLRLTQVPPGSACSILNPKGTVSELEPIEIRLACGRS
jgi:Dolichyl-phosphate-mannose-protein mannosyltransferase